MFWDERKWSKASYCYMLQRRETVHQYGGTPLPLSVRYTEIRLSLWDLSPVPRFIVRRHMSSEPNV